MASAEDPEIIIADAGGGAFTLAVRHEGRLFECGTYHGRGEAMRAGRLFVDRKLAEARAKGKRPGKKR